jgi:hypothetical protein
VSESRTGQRYPVQLPTRIQAKGSAEVHLGETNDLSAAGAYIVAQADFEVGTAINFEVCLPQEIVASDVEVRLQCSGRVVRVDTETKDHGEVRGVACVIDHYEFVRDF